MRHKVIGVAGLGLLIGGASRIAAQQAPPAIVRQIQAVENDWSKAYQTKDVSIFSRILGPDYYCFSTWDGKRASARDEVEGTTADKATYSSVTNTVRVVRLYGGVAIALGEGVSKGSENGKAFDRRYSWQTVFTKRGDQWVAVACHVAQIPLTGE
jgi:ketosteroid isomerase-like protein